MKDTPEHVDELHRAMLMSLSGEERLRMGADMFDSALQMMRAGIEAAHGPLPEVEMRERLLWRLYGDELTPAARHAVARHVPERVARGFRPPPADRKAIVGDADVWDVDDPRWTDEIFGKGYFDDDPAK